MILIPRARVGDDFIVGVRYAPDEAQTGGITVWGGEPRVSVQNSYGGGKQIFFSQGMASCWVGYKGRHGDAAPSDGTTMSPDLRTDYGR